MVVILLLSPLLSPVLAPLPAPTPSLPLSPTRVVAELQLHLPGLPAGGLAHFAVVQLQSVALQVNLGAEDNKFIFLALRLSAEVVVGMEMVSQLRVVVVEILDSISITQETEEMFCSQMFEQLFIIKEARITELAQRMPLKYF